MRASLATIAPPATRHLNQSEGRVRHIPDFAKRALTDPQQPRKGRGKGIGITCVDRAGYIPRHPRQMQHTDLIRDGDQAARAFAQISHLPLTIQPLGMGKPRRQFLERATYHILGIRLTQL